MMNVTKYLNIVAMVVVALGAASTSPALAWCNSTVVWDVANPLSVSGGKTFACECYYRVRDLYNQKEGSSNWKRMVGGGANVDLIPWMLRL